MSPLVNCDRMQIIPVVISVEFCPRLCSICRRSLYDQAQMVCRSGLDHCRVCVQKKNSLRAEMCSSGAAETASEIPWIMIEFSHDLQIIYRNPANLTRVPNI